MWNNNVLFLTFVFLAVVVLQFTMIRFAMTEPRVGFKKFLKGILFTGLLSLVSLVFYWLSI